MEIVNTPETTRLVEFLSTRGVGRRNPVSTRTLATMLAVPKRAVGELVADAIEDGALIGSSFGPEAVPLFDLEDVGAA
jgi:hypothetical protein